MSMFRIFSDGRAAGSVPVSGSDFVTKDYLAEAIISGTAGSIEAIEVNGTASVVTNKTASISLELPSGSDVVVLPVDNSLYDSETGTWNLGTGFVTEVSAALADNKAVYLKVTDMDGVVYPACTLDMHILYGFGGITMPGNPSVVHTWQLRTQTGVLMYITSSVQNYIPGLEEWVTQYSQSLIETEHWVTDSGSVAMSASSWVTQNSGSVDSASIWVGDHSASLVASASFVQSVGRVAASASEELDAISAKTGSWDALEGLPAVTAVDNGKILRVVSGSWALEMPVAVYNGSAAPSDSLGNNGDIYLQTS